MQLVSESCDSLLTVQELVQYYLTTSLERSFPEVPITLGLPYKEAITPAPPPRGNKVSTVFFVESQAIGINNVIILVKVFFFQFEQMFLE
jgi:hypothetical protein